MKLFKPLVDFGKKLEASRFFIGFCFFSIGMIGLFVSFLGFYFKSIDDLWGDEVWFHAQIENNFEQIEPLKEILKKVNIGSTLQEDFSPELLNLWVEKDLSLALVGRSHFLAGAKYKSKSLAEDFMKHFLLPDESLVIEENSYGTLYLPSYSSQRAFLLYEDWLLWGNSKEVLLGSLDNPNKLSDTESYRQIIKDMPRDNFFFIFMDMENSHLEADTYNASLTPLIRSLKSVMPAFGVALRPGKDKINWYSKFLVAEDIYQEGAEKIKNNTIPNIAYFVPKDVLFFMNGSNLKAKYQHTQNFLSKLESQLLIIFEGILRSQFKHFFGDSFDYKEDFIDYLEGEYGFFFDFGDEFEFGFIAEMKKQNIAKKDIEKLILSAQARFYPEIEEFKLPNGKVRKELVARDINALPIKEKKIDDQVYFTIGNIESQDFSYGFVNKYFLFSSNEEVLKSMITLYKKKSDSLALDKNFQESILFDFKASQSYGVFSFQKFKDFLSWIEFFDDENSLNSFFKGEYGLKHFIFSQLVYPEAIFIRGSIFSND